MMWRCSARGPIRGIPRAEAGQYATPAVSTWCLLGNGRRSKAEESGEAGSRGDGGGMVSLASRQAARGNATTDRLPNCWSVRRPAGLLLPSFVSNLRRYAMVTRDYRYAATAHHFKFANHRSDASACIVAVRRRENGPRRDSICIGSST